MIFLCRPLLVGSLWTFLKFKFFCWVSFRFPACRRLCHQLYQLKEWLLSPNQTMAHRSPVQTSLRSAPLWALKWATTTSMATIGLHWNCFAITIGDKSSTPMAEKCRSKVTQLFSRPKPAKNTNSSVVSLTLHWMSRRWPRVFRQDFLLFRRRLTLDSRRESNPWRIARSAKTTTKRLTSITLMWSKTWTDGRFVRFFAATTVPNATLAAVMMATHFAIVH